jgi:hydroxyacylglutathione hydrolase
MSALFIKSFVFNAFMENTYVVYDEEGNAAIFDPGCYEKEEEKALEMFIEQHGLKVQALYNTHCHIDHVLGNEFVKRRWKVGLQIHAVELPYLEAVKSYAGNYGFHGYQPAEPNSFIKEGSSISIGKHQLQILFAPGHAPGHVLIYDAAGDQCLVGDVIFKGSIGRTDLPGGDFDTLIKSIKTQLFNLPDHTRLYPGHGEPTTVGFEKEYNPFCGRYAGFES